MSFETFVPCLKSILCGNINVYEIAEAVKCANPEIDEKQIARNLLRLLSPYSEFEKDYYEKFNLIMALDECFEYVSDILEKDSERNDFLDMVNDVCRGLYVPWERKMVSIEEALSDENNRVYKNPAAVIDELKQLINNIVPNYIGDEYDEFFGLGLEMIEHLISVINHDVLKTTVSSDSDYLMFCDRFREIMFPEQYK